MTITSPESTTDSTRPTVVIGIHGLNNKSAPQKAQKWWHQAIEEGLQRNANASPQYIFELVYWADVNNDAPVPDAEQKSPYKPADGEGALPAYDAGVLDSVRGFVQEWVGRGLDKEKDLIGLGSNVEKIIGVKLKDLDVYYQKDSKRRAMRDRLITALRRHAGSKIVLIGHSMGSIIAYDVLRELDDDPTLRIDHFITMGSPLGLPIVAMKNEEYFGNRKTPVIAKRWTNVSDPRDKVALDCILHDEYAENAQGITVEDTFIVNGYVNPQGEDNNHKSYGYLRAPEVTELLMKSLT